MNTTQDNGRRPVGTRNRWIKWILFCLSLLLLAAIALPNFVRARVTTCESACINGLRQLDAAKHQWAVEHRKPAGHVLNAEEKQILQRYIKGGIPTCPGGGTYTLNPVGEPPACDFSLGSESHRLSTKP